MSKQPLSRAARSWILYDWASSAFATTVMAGFFPVFFKQFWSSGVDVTVSSLRLGTISSTASLIVAVCAPLLGAIADAGNARKRFLLVFAATGALATVALFAVPSGLWMAAAVVYIIAIVGFSGSNVFYDSLLVAVSPPGRNDYVSAVGFAIGYLGGGVLFAVNVAMTLFPAAFGLTDASQAVRVSFLLVGAWWIVFSIPLARNVVDTTVQTPRRVSFLDGFRQLVQTMHEIRRFRMVLLFLVAYWLYIDGVHTIVRMAVDYGMSLGFSSNHLIGALLVVQFVAFPASYGFAKIAESTGARKAIFGGIAVYVGISIWGYRLQHVWEFYGLAVAIGLVQGGVTSLSRSYFSRLIPAAKSAQFFGFYNTVGRFSAVIGPVLMGWVSHATGNPRYSMFAITALFLLGGTILRFVPEPADK